MLSIFTKPKLFLLGLIFSSALNLAKAQEYHSLLISEIFADPTPSRGLPEKEFIELYNNSNDVISLKGISLSYANSKVELPAYELEAGKYVIAARFNNAELFEPYGDVISLDKFSLLNSGTTLKLESRTGVLIHQVSYLSDWYATGRDQGYSLEMIDLNLACKGADNWTSSISELGATPGSVNSVNEIIIDNDSPFLVSFNTENNKDYTFIFSENINGSLDEVNIDVQGAEIETLGLLNGNEVHLSLEEEILPGDVVQVVFEGIADCVGNLSELIKLELSNVKSAEKGEVVLSEVLFNPKPGVSDFVEIYNTTQNQLNLLGLGFAKRNSLNEIDDFELISQNVIIQPHQFLCFTEDKMALIQAYPKAKAENIIEVQNIPSYTNESGDVVITNSDEEIFDEFSYHEDFHHFSIDDPDGVSLERLINQDQTASSVWRSTSASENYATPGYFLMNTTSGSDLPFTLKLSAPYFTPDQDGLDETCHLQVESLKEGLLTIHIYSTSGRQVKRVVTNQYSSQFFSFEWNGLSDLGEELPMGYYIVSADFISEGETYRDQKKLLLARAD
ncbi:lamin tail domain-containing protein [Jiulongibacter sp. NS-SX5]|uniref:lamin tail domain-containing protein n=1 Tax=Jiulongibacter sp. NS-SX5 TaxID=3463854 RepID=UPI0040595775